jgi:hypothetical protein
MAISLPNPGRAALLGIVRKGMFLLSALTFGLLFPSLVLWGGSTNLINWGPGLLLAGAACLLLLDKDRLTLRGGGLHSGCFLLLLGLLFVRARNSPDVAATANNSALLAMAAAGFLIGRLAGGTKSRTLFIGLSLVAMLNLFCSVMQMTNPEWNLIYPQRSAAFPSGLFAHYSYSAAFCLGSVGLLVSRSYRECAWLKAVLIGGAVCALVTIPISISRGGNLALAFMVAAACALLLARAFSNSGSVMSTLLPAFVFLALVLIFGASFVTLIGRNTGPDGFYADGVRINFWNAATQISTDHPWLGGGPGSFAWNVFHLMDGLTTEPGMVHNEALQLAVDYGYPALIGMAALISVPVILCFWRFVNKTDTANTSWAAIGLLAMLFQSNFESIFHAAPGAFIAALILGQISRGLWGMESTNALKNVNGANDRERPDRHFLSAIKAHADDYSAGGREAVSMLVRLLSQSKDEQWRRGAYRLTYWTKVQHEDALRQAVKNLGAKSSEELRRLSTRKNPLAEERVAASSPRRWRILGNLALGGCALSILLSGAGLSLALIDAWVPVYHPNRLSISKRFDRLISLVENNPGLGIDRKVLSAARDCIYQFKSQEAREYWATVYRPRILRAIPGWRKDPGAALQIAEIIGWAGDVESALNFYNHAIATQGDNESLFMAYSFKGQYIYELSISAGAAGQAPQQKFYAQLAVECFKNANAALGKNRRRIAPYFGKMLLECEAFGRKDM